MKNKYLKFLEKKEQIYNSKDLTIEEQVEHIYAINKSYLLSLTKNNQVATIAIYDLLTIMLSVSYKKDYVEKYFDINAKLDELIKVVRENQKDEE